MTDPRESVRVVAQELMEAEVSELIAAQRGERTEDRATHRNGYRSRRWDTRPGEIELQIPKIRQGSYFPAAGIAIGALIGLEATWAVAAPARSTGAVPPHPP